MFRRECKLEVGRARESYLGSVLSLDSLGSADSVGSGQSPVDSRLGPGILDCRLWTGSGEKSLTTPKPQLRPSLSLFGAALDARGEQKEERVKLLEGPSLVQSASIVSAGAALIGSRAAVR